MWKNKFIFLVLFLSSYLFAATSSQRVSATFPILIDPSTGAIYMNHASTMDDGYITSDDFNLFLQNVSFTAGNFTTATSGVTITGGTNAVNGTVALSIATASAGNAGLLSAANWSTFNAKQAALTIGNLTSGTTGVSISGGSSSVIGSGASVSVQTASGSQPGLLSAADWTTFNDKLGSISVSDTSSIDLTYSSNTVSGVVLPAGVDHNSLANLTTGDPHTQYFKVTGRSNEDLNMTGTGSILFGDGSGHIGDLTHRPDYVWSKNYMVIGRDLSAHGTALNMSHDGSTGYILERDPGISSYISIWVGGGGGWGLASNPSSDFNKFYFYDYTTGKMLSFENSTGAPVMTFLQTGGKLAPETDAGMSIGDQTHRLDKLYSKNRVIVGTDTGVAAPVFSAANVAGNAGVVLGPANSGSGLRLVYTDLTTGQWGFYSDGTTPDIIDVKNVAGTALVTFQTDGSLSATSGFYQKSLTTHSTNTQQLDINLTGLPYLQKISLGASSGSPVTVTFTNPKMMTYRFVIFQTVSARAITWGNTIKWPGNTPPTLTTTLGHYDIVDITYDGTNYYGRYDLDYP